MIKEGNERINEMKEYFYQNTFCSVLKHRITNLSNAHS